MSQQNNNNVKSITVFGFGPSFDPVRIDPSPAVLKVLAFLSYHNIPYKLNASMKPSPVAQRFPWIIIEYNDNTPKKVVEDSRCIIEEVSKLYNNIPRS